MKLDRDKKSEKTGMLNTTCEKNEGKYRGGEGKTPVTMTCPEGRAVEGETSYELSWRTKAVTKKQNKNTSWPNALVILQQYCKDERKEVSPLVFAKP